MPQPQPEDVNMFCKFSDLRTESDVEQKIVFPLLTQKKPSGLGYSASEILTKPNIKDLLIDKGSAVKLYYPDYIIVIAGLPSIAIEVKTPNESVKEGLRQARLYASELNYSFPKNINPCNKIISINGSQMIYGNVDSADHDVILNFTDFNSVIPSFAKFIGFCSQETVKRDAEIFLKSLRGKSKFIKPKQLLGGKASQNTEVKENSFGATLSLEFRNIFNPQTSIERKDIIDNAYVATKRLTRHIMPIERIIKKSKIIGSSDIRIIEDTEVPIEITSKFSNTEKLRNELLLLIGNVGAGKSTFTDYLKEKGLPPEVKDNTSWISINLNNAPVNRDEIYTWVKHNIADSLVALYNHIDLEEKDELLKLYGPEFKSLRKGAASFFEPGSLEYNKLFAEKLIELEKNIDTRSIALVRYLCTNRGKLLIVVLDNCDKRNAEEQLLMFEVANWLKEYYNCLVFLPLRDTTYNLYRKQKPLDTIIKDLVFRIDPPLLREVIISRVRYTLRLLNKGKKTLFYELPNGVKVEYPESEQGLYLASIVRSLFENTYFSRLISGIAGRDTRKGLEVFLDFCRSGHIDETEILKMKKFGATHSIPNHYISKILLRGNRKYYSSDDSIIKSLFSSYPDQDILPNPFTRLFIINWLQKKYYIDGPSSVRGYHKAESLINDLIIAGHERTRIIQELNTLIKYGLVFTESQRDQFEGEQELISLSSYGFIHLDILGDVSYFSAIAEDTYFKDTTIATEIHHRITGKSNSGINSSIINLENSDALVKYLLKYTTEVLPITSISKYAESNLIDLYNLTEIQKNIESLRNRPSISKTLKAVENNPSGTIIEGEIVSVQSYGVFVEFGLYDRGMIHISSFERMGKLIEDYEEGDRIIAKIKSYQNDTGRYLLNFVKDVESQ